jgi:hypothetical protein
VNLKFIKLREGPFLSIEKLAIVILMLSAASLTGRVTGYRDDLGKLLSNSSRGWEMVIP